MTPTVLYRPSDTFYAFQHYDIPYRHTAFPYQPYLEYAQQPAFYPASFSYHSNQYHHHVPQAMSDHNPAELEDFQRLSDEYRAELPGPLIGDKLPMSVLATEYAQADPTYVVKTTTLARSYSGYRNVKGDGQCGWRGTVFGYFETLLRLGDIDILQQERVRLLSFEETMRVAGIDYDLMIDMFDSTWELFEDIQNALERHEQNESVILNYLNDTVRSDCIVYHFKMMTSAFMQLRAEQYEPFLEIPIADYRVSRIDPANQEIDQIGLQVLTDAVIAPANFALEVLYLDRSIGEEATPHPFVADYLGKPTIRLLYRPGHYDLIYKEEPTVQVFLQRENLLPRGVEMAPSSSISGDLQAYLFSGPQAASPHSHSEAFYGFDQSPNTSNRNQYLFSPHPQPPPVPQPVRFDHAIQQQLPGFTMEISSGYPIPYASPCSTEMTTSPHPISPLLSTSTAPPSSPLAKLNGEPQIRLNANCFNYSMKHESVPLSSQPWGCAASLSPAHFRNLDFQPQMWIAEEEYFKS